MLYLFNKKKDMIKYFIMIIIGLFAIVMSAMITYRLMIFLQFSDTLSLMTSMAVPCLYLFGTFGKD